MEQWVLELNASLAHFRLRMQRKCKILVVMFLHQYFRLYRMMRLVFLYVESFMLKIQAEHFR
jgi:hypothetical protein